MPLLKRNSQTGDFYAVWRNNEGREISHATGEFIEERAWKKAAEFEAESRFWEDQKAGVWIRLAEASFSPRYLHKVFIGRAHVAFARFRALLREAEVKFQPPGRWRDATKARGTKPGRKWQYRGGKRSLDELLEFAAGGVSRAALRHRLEAKWDIHAALSTPPLSQAEAGLMGARISNNQNRKRA